MATDTTLDESRTEPTTEPTTADPAAAATADQMAAKIDEALADTHLTANDSHSGDSSDSSDVDPESLEAQLKLALPAYTYFQRHTALPKAVQALAQHLGASAEDLAGAPEVIKAVYTVPEGVWMIEIGVCHGGEHGYKLVIDGPDTDLTREPKTVTELLDILRFVGAAK